MVAVFVIFIHYISLCTSDWDQCFDGEDVRARTIPDLPCWGKCVQEPESQDVHGCPIGSIKIEPVQLSDNLCDNPKKRNLCKKNNVDWKKYIEKGETDTDPSCKNKRCNSQELFAKDEYCRPATGESCPPDLTTTSEEDKGICYKVNDNQNPGANPGGYELVSFCKTDIHFQYHKNLYKRMSPFKQIHYLCIQHIICIYICSHTIIHHLGYK